MLIPKILPGLSRESMSNAIIMEKYELFGNFTQKTIYQPVGYISDKTDIDSCLHMHPDMIASHIRSNTYKSYHKLTSHPQIILEDENPYQVRRTTDGLFLFKMDKSLGLVYYRLSEVGDDIKIII